MDLSFLILFSRLLQAPKLLTFSLSNLDLPKEDCLDLIKKLQAGACCQLLETFRVYFSGPVVHDKLPILCSAIATFCPNVNSVVYKGSNGKNALMNICSKIFKFCSFKGLLPSELGLY